MTGHGKPAPGPTPDIVAIKAIARDGFSYGLPIVMNACIIDKNSGQRTTAFNQIFCEARVLTDRNTAIPTPT